MGVEIKHTDSMKCTETVGDMGRMSFKGKQTSGDIQFGRLNLVLFVLCTK